MTEHAIHYTSVDGLVDAMYVTLREQGEITVRDLPNQSGLSTTDWADGIRNRGERDGIEVTTYKADCGCCASAIIEGWGGRLGPIRVAFDAYLIAYDAADAAVEACDAQMDKLEALVRGVEDEA